MLVQTDRVLRAHPPPNRSVLSHDRIQDRELPRSTGAGGPREEAFVDTSRIVERGDGVLGPLIDQAVLYIVAEGSHPELEASQGQASAQLVGHALIHRASVGPPRARAVSTKERTGEDLASGEERPHALLVLLAGSERAHVHVDPLQEEEVVAVPCERLVNLTEHEVALGGALGGEPHVRVGPVRPVERNESLRVRSAARAARQRPQQRESHRAAGSKQESSTIDHGQSTSSPATTAPFIGS